MNRYDMKEAYYRLKNEYFVDDLSVSYTLKTDDITKGAKPQGTPYLSRKGGFDENGANAETGKPSFRLRKIRRLSCRIENDERQVIRIRAESAVEIHGQEELRRLEEAISFQFAV